MLLDNFGDVLFRDARCVQYNHCITDAVSLETCEDVAILKHGNDCNVGERDLGGLDGLGVALCHWFVSPLCSLRFSEIIIHL